jgi:DNA-binding HxlR family transcriptional regulator
MRHKDIGNTQCPIARSLDRVGEWWSILILRDAFHGLTRFDQFQKRLGIAPNMLTRRLATLVDSGLLERRLYRERPPRHEYVLTERGRDFRPVLWALLAWGNKHFSPEGTSVQVVDAATGEPADPVLVDGNTGRLLSEPQFKISAGPAANERTRRHYARLDDGAEPDQAGADGAASGQRRMRAASSSKPRGGKQSKTGRSS